MKAAVILLLVCCLFVLVIILRAIAKIHDDNLDTITKCINNLAGYKHDDLYCELCDIDANLRKLVEKKANVKEETQPDPTDAFVVEPCPICGSVPAMYKHTELNSYCIRCSGGLSKTKYDASCNCSICVVSDDKTAAITAWNDAVNDYIMHKNEED